MLIWVSPLGIFRSVNRSRSWCFKIFPSRMWSRSGVGVWKMWLRSSLLCCVLFCRDDHYPIYWLDIRQDSEFAIGYGYQKTTFKREPYTDPDIRNAFVDILRFRLLEKVAHCAIIHLF